MNDKLKAQLHLDLFRGRRDVYGRQKVTQDGKKLYFPVCKNFWDENLCHIRKKDGVQCMNCKAKAYDPVTEKTVLKHIKGEESQLTYLLQEDGMVYFAALDLDQKPGKEGKGHNFEDAKKIIEVLKAWGIHYRIARSTGEGFHIYIFLSEAYPANKIRAILMAVFDEVGFFQEMQQGVRPLPELFPKQTTGGLGGIGNGIKTPMIESRFEAQRNCLVDDENVMIPADLQWDYLAKSGRNEPAHLDALIEQRKIEVAANNPGTSSYRGVEGFHTQKGQWSQPKTGSMEKVVAACPAFRTLMKKIEKGHVPGHDEGFALYHMAMNTADGLDWFKKNVRGWAQTDAEMNQLQHSLQKNYSPWTCKTMQEKGVCTPGTKCMEKRPPLINVEGEMVRADVPEDQWKEPSPIRYSYGKGEVFMAQLQEEIVDLKAEKDPDVRMQVIKEIARRAQVFDQHQRRALMDHIYKLGLAKKSDLKPIFTEASEEAEQRAKEKQGGVENVVCVNNVIYERLENGKLGYAFMKTGRNGTDVVSEQFCPFEIKLEEERTYYDQHSIERTAYSGKFIGKTRTIEFEINSDQWADNKEFTNFFERIGGSDFMLDRNDAGHVKTAAKAFAAKDVSYKKNKWFSSHGYYGETFLTPSAIVDKDGIRPNTEKQVDLSTREHAKSIDFKILSDPEFKDVLFHIKTDVFKTWPRRPLFVTLTQTLQAGIHHYLGFSSIKPTVWIEGDSGGGKSAMTAMAQQFWGNFQNILRWEGATVPGVTASAHDFKDACLVIDDYKAKDREPFVAKALLQSVYDPSASAKANRDGSLRTIKPSRCLLLCSGELTPASQASTIARMILVRYPKWNAFDTKASFERVLDMSQHYCGITPRFIHFVLNHDRNLLIQRVRDNVDLLSKDVQASDNGMRVSKNLAISTMVWGLFVDFMLSNDVIDRNEAEALKKEYWGYAIELRDDIISRCDEEKIGTIFTSILREKLQSGEVSIKNLDGFEHENTPIIGFVKTTDAIQNTAYCYPHVLYNEVIKHGKSYDIDVGIRAIGTQMVSMGVITDHDKGKNMKLVRLDGGRSLLWLIRLDQLGLFEEGQAPKVVGGTTPMKLEPAPVDSDGLI